MGALGGAAAVLGAEVCAPLLMLCWLCCWPEDGSSDTSSGKRPKKPVVVSAGARRPASSAASLPLPGASGVKNQPPSAHRSHEEIRSRRKSHHESHEDAARYHSAPSVIDEVLHRRDWERSTRELHAGPRDERPQHEQRPPGAGSDVGGPREAAAQSRKELAALETKDEDLSAWTSSTARFYIGECARLSNEEDARRGASGRDEECTAKAKELKQSLNESLRCREWARNVLGPLAECRVSAPHEDRSGAVHRLDRDDSRSVYCDTPSVPYPPLSAELADGEVGGGVGAVCAVGAVGGGECAVSERCAARARHASAGDVLAPLLRPHSAALSESDLDLELECCDEPPPAYDELRMLAIAQRKETAI